MKKIAIILIVVILIMIFGTASGEEVSGMRELFQSPEITSTPAPYAFRFRDGIRWSMNTQQVRALETEPMTERTMQNWSIMLTDGKVVVSRFTADLVFMFLQDKLQMISYEFQKGDNDEFLYLNGALAAVYGEKSEADPLKIKALMDSINPNRYRTELITHANVWTTSDGTTIYLYYYSRDSFAITYVNPELGSRIYNTNGL